MVATNSIRLKYPIILENMCFLVDLVILPLQEIDIILGLDWLLANLITPDCARKTVPFSDSPDILPTMERVTKESHMPQRYLMLSSLEAKETLLMKSPTHHKQVMLPNELCKYTQPNK